MGFSMSNHPFARVGLIALGLLVSGCRNEPSTLREEAEQAQENLEAAREEAADLIAESEEEAVEVVVDARQDAEEMVRDAKQQASSLVQDAEQDLTQKLDELGDPTAINPPVTPEPDVPAPGTAVD